MTSGRYSRRDFLKLAGTTALLPFIPQILKQTPATVHAKAAPDFPQAERLGRVCADKARRFVRPTPDSKELDPLYFDAVVPWLREVTGEPLQYRNSRRWVETPDGYLYAPQIQPVSNQLNPPVTTLPETTLGSGTWAEITVPWVDFELANGGPRSPWLKGNTAPHLYYSQVYWVDQIDLSTGSPRYRLNERYGYGDLFWVDAAAMRPLTPEELAPIHPEAENKRITVDLHHQTMHCFENEHEVFYTRISSGPLLPREGKPPKWSTPVGPHPIWRKLISHHMSGGDAVSGWDLPGIAWTALFAGSGVAIHSTYWHNDYGVPRSRGCVNARPEDAKWVFRWSLPSVSWEQGEITVTDDRTPTWVTVVEA